MSWKLQTPHIPSFVRPIPATSRRDNVANIFPNALSPMLRMVLHPFSSPIRGGSPILHPTRPASSASVKPMFDPLSPQPGSVHWCCCLIRFHLRPCPISSSFWIPCVAHQHFFALVPDLIYLTYQFSFLAWRICVAWKHFGWCHLLTLLTSIEPPQAGCSAPYAPLDVFSVPSRQVLYSTTSCVLGDGWMDGWMALGESGCWVGLVFVFGRGV